MRIHLSSHAPCCALQPMLDRRQQWFRLSPEGAAGRGCTETAARGAFARPCSRLAATDSRRVPRIWCPHTGKPARQDRSRLGVAMRNFEAQQRPLGRRGVRGSFQWLCDRLLGSCPNSASVDGSVRKGCASAMGCTLVTTTVLVQRRDQWHNRLGFVLAISCNEV